MTSTPPTPDDQPPGDAPGPDAASGPGDARDPDAVSRPGDAPDPGVASWPGEPWTSPAAALGAIPTTAEVGVVSEVGAGGSSAGWRARLKRHPVATGAVAATLAAGVAFGAGVLVGQATSTPDGSAWTERSGPRLPPDGVAGGGRDGFDRGVVPGGTDDGTTRGGTGGAGGTGGTDT